MRKLVFFLLLLPLMASAQAPMERPKPQKKDPRAPVVRKGPPTAGETARKENRQYDRVSKTMKKRQPAKENAVRNER